MVERSYRAIVIRSGAKVLSRYQALVRCYRAYERIWLNLRHMDMINEDGNELNQSI